MFRGFITNLGKYNEGELVGRWIDFPLTEDIDDIMESIGIDGVEYEEYFFTDYDTDEDTIIIDGLGEYENIDRLNDYAEELGCVYDFTHLLAYVEATGYTLEDAIGKYEGCSSFYGDSDIEDVMIELLVLDEDAIENIRYHIDWEGVARDYGLTETEYGLLYI